MLRDEIGRRSIVISAVVVSKGEVEVGGGYFRSSEIQAQGSK